MAPDGIFFGSRKGIIDFIKMEIIDGSFNDYNNALKKDGYLSVTVRYHGPNGYRLKTEVPVPAIEFVVHDIFIILECTPGSGKMYKSKNENVN